MPPPNPPKSKRNRNMLIGAAAVGLLLLLYLRSRSAAGSSSADAQQAAAQAAQTQAQQDAGLYGSSTPSTFADNGANAAALGDAITAGFQQFETNPPAWYTPPSTTTGDGSTGAGATAPPPPPPPVQITINGNGQPAGGAPTTAGVTQPGPPKDFANLDAKYLAPGAKAPNYLLVPPKGAPQNARWAGAKSPGKGWAGIGGGWWKPVKR